MDVKLVMFKANGQRRDYPVSADKITIGRATECELQVPLGTVSRKQCTITIAEGKLHLKDLGSSNGTFVNDQRVQEVELKAGDTVTVGPVIFTVVINNLPEQIKPIRTVIVEHSVEPVTPRQGAEGTVDVEAEEEAAELPANPLAALEAMSKRNK